MTDVLGLRYAFRSDWDPVFTVVTVLVLGLELSYYRGFQRGERRYFPLPCRIQISWHNRPISPNQRPVTPDDTATFAITTVPSRPWLPIPA
jgi:hypothetical protein